MGMLDWFKSIVRGDSNAAASAPAAGAADDKGAELAGLVKVCWTSALDEMTQE